MQCLNLFVTQMKLHRILYIYIFLHTFILAISHIEVTTHFLHKKTGHRISFSCAVQESKPRHLAYKTSVIARDDDHNFQCINE